MCGGGSAPKAPPPPAVLPEAPHTPEPREAGSTEDRDRRRRQLAAGKGRGSTILTGPQGVRDEAQTGTKTLLGA